MHRTTKLVNSQVTKQLADLSSLELFIGTLNLCLDQAERKQPNSHKHMKMTHSIPMAVLQEFSFFVWSLKGDFRAVRGKAVHDFKIL